MCPSKARAPPSLQGQGSPRGAHLEIPAPTNPGLWAEQPTARFLNSVPRTVAFSRARPQTSVPRQTPSSKQPAAWSVPGGPAPTNTAFLGPILASHDWVLFTHAYCIHTRSRPCKVRDRYPCSRLPCPVTTAAVPEPSTVVGASHAAGVTWADLDQMSQNGGRPRSTQRPTYARLGARLRQAGRVRLEDDGTDV